MTLTISGGNGSGAYDLTGTGECSLASTSDPTRVTLSGTNPGPCSVKARKLESSGFLTSAYSVPVNIVVNPLQTQTSLTYAISSLTFNNNTATLPVATGGSGSGAITYESTTPSICTVSGETVTRVATGDCTVRATKAASANYASIFAESTFSVVMPPQPQAALAYSLTGYVFPANENTLQLPAATGGSGSGAITYESTTPSKCTVSGTILTRVATGSCSVRATKAASGTYGSISAVGNIEIASIASTNPCGNQDFCNVTMTESETPLRSGIGEITVSFKANFNVVTKACLSWSGSGRPVGSPSSISGDGFHTISGIFGDGAGYGAGTLKLVKNSACDNYPASGFAPSTTIAGGWGSGVYVASPSASAAQALPLTSTRACSGNNRTYNIIATSSAGAPSPTLSVTSGGAACSLSGTTLTITGQNSCTVTSSVGRSSAQATFAAALTDNFNFERLAMPPRTDGGNYLEAAENFCRSERGPNSIFQSEGTGYNAQCTQTRPCLVDRFNARYITNFGYTTGWTTPFDVMQVICRTNTPSCGP